jgi:photosystem II stability/assembly factor-like uncharacterized protein
MLRLPQAVAAHSECPLDQTVERADPSALYPGFSNCRAASPNPALAAFRDAALQLSRRGGVCWLVAFLCFVVTSPSSLPAAETSEVAPLAARSLLLDVTRAGPRLVTVGDRGHVLLSDDEGASWRQVIVPTRAMLTGVSFGTPTHGWAVGHDGVILASTNAGLTWIRQDAGDDLETSWLDVFGTGEHHVLAVGAYGRCAYTIDGGKTWQPASPPPEELHLNHIAPTDTDNVYVSGEAGTLLASDDARKEWHKLEVPYDGSLYGLIPLGGARLLVYGLRGRVYLSEDAGKTWTLRETATPVLIMAGIRLKSGAIVLAGLGGNFHLSRDDGASFSPWQPAGYNGGVSALLEAVDGALVVVGEKGAARLTLP